MAKLTKLERLSAKLKEVANDIVMAAGDAEAATVLRDCAGFLEARADQCWADAKLAAVLRERAALEATSPNEVEL